MEEMLGIESPDRDLPRPNYTSEEILPFTSKKVKQLIDTCMHPKVVATKNRKPEAQKRDRPKG
jgi:hypothetical protein